MWKLREPLRPTNALLHPLWWGALGLLLLNDHWLKGGGLVSSALTGKLSDFSGLLMAPALVATLLCVRTRGGWLACHAAVAAAFAALKLSKASVSAYVALGALFGLRYAVVLDRSDLWALASVVLSLFVFGRAGVPSVVSAAWARLVRLVGTAVGSVASAYVVPPMSLHTAVSANEVHVIHSRSSVDILDANSGRLVRSVPFDVAPHGLGIRDLPGTALRDGFVYAQDGRVLDARTGRERFRFSGHQNTIGVVGHLLIACLDERTAAAHDLRSGVIVWQQVARCLPNQAVASDRFVALSDGKSEIELLETATGRSRGRLPFALRVELPLYGSDAINALYPELAGRVGEDWELAPPQVFLAGPRGTIRLWLEPTSRSASEQPLATFDPALKQKLWSTSARSLILDAPSLVVAESQNGLAAFDSQTGARLWFRQGYAGDYAASETLFVLHSQGKAEDVTALDLRTGRRLWAASLPR